MKNKSDIVDEVFIPDGLEFREEYLEQAMHMYALERRKVWLRKVWISSLAAAVLAGVGLFFYFDARKEDSIASAVVEPSSVTTQELNTSAQEDLEVKEVKSDDHGSAEAEKQNSENEVVGGRNETTANNNTGVYPKTSESGGSLSSGFESPIPGSISGISSGRSSKRDRANRSIANNKQRPAEMATSQDGFSSELNLEIPEKSDEVSSTVDNIASAGERVGVPEKITAIALHNLDGNQGLRPFQRIPSVIERNWSLFVQGGIIPFADYGSGLELRPDLNVGFGGKMKLKGGYSISGTAEYFQISKINHPHSVSSTTYDLDYSTITTTYLTERLDYAGLNLIVSKKLGGSHFVGLGYAANYLLTGVNSIENYTQTYDAVGPSSTQKSKGFVAGFADLNQQILLSYEYAAGRNKAFGLQARYGLTDITRKGYFENAGLHRNSFIMAYFKFNLIQ